jgi:type IV secretory pathway protease TraF
MSRKQIVLTIYAFVLLAVTTITTLSLGYGVAYSPTNSMPYNYFITKTVNKPSIVKKDDIAVFQMPKKFYSFENLYLKNGLWYPVGSSLVKYIGCVSGEKINTVGRKDYCDGKLIAVVPHFATDFPVKHEKIKVFYEYNNVKIPNGYFYAMGPDKYSLDSRYFGLVKIKSIKKIGYGIKF